MTKTALPLYIQASQYAKGGKPVVAVQICISDVFYLTANCAKLKINKKGLICVASYILQKEDFNRVTAVFFDGQETITCYQRTTHPSPTSEKIIIPRRGHNERRVKILFLYATYSILLKVQKPQQIQLIQHEFGNNSQIVLRKVETLQAVLQSCEGSR